MPQEVAPKLAAGRTIGDSVEQHRQPGAPTAAEALFLLANEAIRELDARRLGRGQPCLCEPDSQREIPSISRMFALFIAPATGRACRDSPGFGEPSGSCVADELAEERRASYALLRGQVRDIAGSELRQNLAEMNAQTCPFAGKRGEDAASQAAGRGKGSTRDDLHEDLRVTKRKVDPGGAG